MGDSKDAGCCPVGSEPQNSSDYNPRGTHLLYTKIPCPSWLEIASNLLNLDIYFKNFEITLNMAYLD